MKNVEDEHQNLRTPNSMHDKDDEDDTLSKKQMAELINVAQQTISDRF